MSMMSPPLPNRLNSVATNAGVAIRYSFYLGGALVFAIIVVAIAYVWFNRVQHIDTPPAFRVAAPQLARLAASGHVTTGGKLGRAEILQYGHLHNRDMNMTVVLFMPRSDTFMGTEAGQIMRNVHSLRPMRAVYTQNYYDLETRFGDVRAADMRAYTDGRWKLCLSFLSRFDIASVFLAGWYCDASGAKPSAHALACMLDRLALDKPLASKSADAFIRARIARPPACSAMPVSQTADTRSRTSKNSPAKWSMPSAKQRY
jgi:hypothetical protein